MMELTFSRPEVQEKYIRLKTEAENYLTEEEKTEGAGGADS